MTSTQEIRNFDTPNSDDKFIAKSPSFTPRYNPLFVRPVNQAQLLFAEAYINGLPISDAACLSWLTKATAFIYQYFPSLLIIDDWITKESDRLAEGSQELMEIQYNLPTQLFKLMLGKTDIMYPKYTMALWEKGATTLQQAQIAMLDDLIAKAEITDGDTILDIGCGWGSAANYILQKFPNVTVTGLNLSHEQCTYIRHQAHQPNSALNSPRFNLVEADFNDVVLEQKFNRIISLGVFEHIGNLSKSFAKVASLLAPEGKVLIHIISTNLPLNYWSPFIHKYIFPYGRVWRYDFIPQCNQNLQTSDRWYLNGTNYAKTLRAWLNNFDLHQDKIQKLDFAMPYPKFRRMWRLYLLWCIAYFEAKEGNILGNAQYLMTHS